MIDVDTEYSKALKKGFPDRLGNDDPTITFQEFYLYYLLRINASLPNQKVDPQKAYDSLPDNDWIHQTWKELKASKKQPMIFSKPWDQVF